MPNFPALSYSRTLIPSHFRDLWLCKRFCKRYGSSVLPERKIRTMYMLLPCEPAAFMQFAAALITVLSTFAAVFFARP